MKNFLRIITKILYSQYFFSYFIALSLFRIHLILSSRVVFGGTKIELLKIYDFSENIGLWRHIQLSYILISFCGCYIIAIFIYNVFFKPFEASEKLFSTKPKSKPHIRRNELNLLVGIDKQNQKWISINEKGIYQNILITGTIGTGKTTSALYPFTRQLMDYKKDNDEMKTAMLILDVKGNYYKQVLEYAKNADRLSDVNIIEINGNVKYNPLHKPDLKPVILANRLKTVLTLFSEQGMSDSYWLDKAESTITEAIKLCRIYNNGYVTFEELHKVISDNKYLTSRIEECKNKFIVGEIPKDKICDLETAITFFENEYKTLDYRTSSIIKSEITRMTQVFISDADIKAVFCCREESLNFSGFKDLIDKGKIVILKMNIAEYRNVSKIISAYLKLDFQSEVMQRLVREGANTKRPVCFISDEYQEYVTKTDSEFFAQSREAKCINIIAVQSYTSLVNSLKNSDTVKTIIQNLINKIWLRTDDIFTIEQVQKQLGRVLKDRTSKTITENAHNSQYSYIFSTFKSDKSNLSESVNITKERDYLFDFQTFTQELQTFEAIYFISNGEKILKPGIVKLQPDFKNKKGE